MSSPKFFEVKRLKKVVPVDSSIPELKGAKGGDEKKGRRCKKAGTKGTKNYWRSGFIRKCFIYSSKR